MAYTQCTADLARNIAIDCANPIVGGYTGRAVLIQWKDVPELTYDATNPRIVKTITLGDSVKTIAVDNVFSDPFSGSNTASSADAGRAEYTKTFALRIPQRGAGASMDIVEPLVSSVMGFLLIVEKKDKVNDGGFEVIGLKSALRANADGIARTESENGGDITVTMSCTEPYFEVTFVGSDGTWATAKEEFEELLAKAF